MENLTKGEVLEKRVTPTGIVFRIVAGGHTINLSPFSRTCLVDVKDQVIVNHKENGGMIAVACFGCTYLGKNCPLAQRLFK